MIIKQHVAHTGAPLELESAVRSLEEGYMRTLKVKKVSVKIEPFPVPGSNKEEVAILCALKQHPHPHYHYAITLTYDESESNKVPEEAIKDAPLPVINVKAGLTKQPRIEDVLTRKRAPARKRPKH